MEHTEDEYEEYITDIYGTFGIGCIEFDAGKILRELDPIAFRVGLSDWDAEEEQKEGNK